MSAKNQSGIEFTTPSEEEINDYVKWLYERPVNNQESYKKQGNVVFLAGNFGKDSEHSVDIAGAQEFLVGVYVAEDSEAESNFSGKDLLDSVDEAISAVESKDIRVDGNQPPSGGGFLVKPTMTTIDFPKDNVYGVPPGKTSSAYGGYFVKIRNVPTGRHTIRFSSKASYSNKPKYGKNYKSDFKMDVTHKVTT